MWKKLRDEHPIVYDAIQWMILAMCIAALLH